MSFSIGKDMSWTQEVIDLLGYYGDDQDSTWDVSNSTDKVQKVEQYFI